MHNIQSPRTDDDAIEQGIQRKGLNAPRLTPAHINDQVLTSQYHVFPGTTVTVCCITLRNGYNVVGKSACASPANFDAEIGRKLAFDNAKNQIWELEGYLLRDFLHANREEFRELAKFPSFDGTTNTDGSIETSEREAR